LRTRDLVVIAHGEHEPGDLRVEALCSYRARTLDAETLSRRRSVPVRV
jgi:hypothetical protein